MCGASMRREKAKRSVYCALRSWSTVVELLIYVKISTVCIRMNITRPRVDQATIERAFSTVCGTCSDGRSKRITDLIVEMIVVDMRPLRMVKCPGFCEMMLFVETGYSCPSATHISILELYLKMITASFASSNVRLY